MMSPGYQPNAGPVGGGVVLTDAGSNAKFKFYTADRPGHTAALRATEIVLDITITLTRAVREVWPVFKDFNLWMNRFGLFWDRLPADSEDGYVHCEGKTGDRILDEEPDAPPTKYIVRRVIPERLIYFDSLPYPIGRGKDGVWTGRNLMTLHGDQGKTTIAIFMEHTWYSETMSIRELRKEAQSVLEAGVAFWRDYFIPDLSAAVGKVDSGR